MKTHRSVKMVDLCTVTPAELDGLWQQEVRFWHDRLFWDVSSTFAALRRIVERGGLPGKAVQVDARTVGYVSYGIAGHLGVISGLALLPDWSSAGVGEMLLKQTIEEIRRQGVSRIESLFVSRDCPWLAPAFERQGFRSYWREFLRFELRRPRGLVSPQPMVALEPWQEAHHREAISIMQAAYSGGVDVEIHERYRTVDGCRVILENILYQGSSGSPVAEASGLARQRGRGIGFILVTEVAPRRGHLTQVAVLPEYQGHGIGRLLLDYSVSRLAESQFDTLSLIVSRANVPALRLYQVVGFQSVLSFPVFVWEG